ncbi:MAG: hypothetical protein WEB00_09425 [Dehalococcoidia bacterium]
MKRLIFAGRGKLVAVAALSLVFTQLSAGGATAAAPLPAGWDLVSGAGECLAAMDNEAFTLEIGTFSDGRYAVKDSVNSAGYSLTSGNGRYYLLIVEGIDSFYAGPVDGRCEWDFFQGPKDLPSWTHMVGAGNNLVLFYNAGSGLAVTATINANHKLIQQETYNLSPGWTHIIGSDRADRRLVFYHSGSGLTVTGQLTTRGEFVQHQTYLGSDHPRVPGPGWTHVAGTNDGGVLFYNEADGHARSFYLKDAGVPGKLAFGGNFILASDFTHVVGAGARGLLLYRNTGFAWGGYLDEVGRWRRARIYGGS